MDQMCMSMVKLQGRLQFSQARAGADVDERWWEGCFGGGFVWLWDGCVFSDVVCCMLYVFGSFQVVFVEV